MHHKDIKEGEDYLFLATDSATRKHLELTIFTVAEIKQVYRKVTWGHRKASRQVYRYFDHDGVGARADELQELPENWPTLTEPQREAWLEDLKNPPF